MIAVLLRRVASLKRATTPSSFRFASRRSPPRDAVSSDFFKIGRRRGGTTTRAWYRPFLSRRYLSLAAMTSRFCGDALAQKRDSGLHFKGFQIFQGVRWCCQTGLNCRPLHYQWSALPLSYGSVPGLSGSAKKASIGGLILATRLPRAQAGGRRAGRSKIAGN